MKITTLFAFGMAAFLASCQPSQYKYESLYADCFPITKSF